MGRGSGRSIYLSSRLIERDGCEAADDRKSFADRLGGPSYESSGRLPQEADAAVRRLKILPQSLKRGEERGPPRGKRMNYY